MKYSIILANIIALLCGTTLESVAASRGIAIEKTPIKNEFVSGNFHALIIGNADYKDKKRKWLPLKTAVNDAKAVELSLRLQYGFENTQLLLNASRKEILQAMYNLGQQVKPEDSVVIYYAGHGYLDEQSKRGYWIPVDAVGDDHTSYIRNSTIKDELSIIASRSRHTLLISDSCFSGSLLRSKIRGTADTDYNQKYYEKVAQKKSVQIITAGGVEFVDDDYRSSGHSPFTYFLLNELKQNQSELISMSELSNRVKIAVANNVDQTPEAGILQGAGDELGDFIFVNLKVSVEVNGKTVSEQNIPLKVDDQRNAQPQILPLPQMKLLPLPVI
ncbi:MAG: caspase family protein [Gammaproteobacteria bacterium]|nr:caspase family protein [Gammaproteobacteria bacterium]